MKEETVVTETVSETEIDTLDVFVDNHQIIKDGVKRVHVFSNDNNSLAIGIINAFILINPDTTIEEVNEAFPINIDENTTGAVIIDTYHHEDIESKLATKFIKIDDYYIKGDYYNLSIYTVDEKSKEIKESSYSIKQKWIVADLTKLKKQAIEYGIEARIGETIGKPYKSYKTPYSLVPVNGFIPQKSKKEEKKEIERKASWDKYMAEYKKKKKSTRKKTFIVLGVIAAYYLYKKLAEIILLHS